MKLLKQYQHQTLRTLTGEWRAWQKEAEKGQEEEELQELDDAAEYASRMDLCRKAGVLDIETMLREKRVAWIAHAARDRSENSFMWIATEIRRKSIWGKQAALDLERYGFTLEALTQQPPDAETVRNTLKEKRAYQTGRGEKPRQKRQKTERTEQMREEQRQRIAQQKAEQEEERRQFVQKIDGKRWVRLPGRRDAWHPEDDAQVLFTATDDFCENTGREILYVAGLTFYRNPEDHTWSTE
ncbi:unnamed protein product [Amoebophrya sp. A120]|nr:unnamed protein product [Amoebophrya sp. A120]|eukprot:GSA120T00016000001.1